MAKINLKFMVLIVLVAVFVTTFSSACPDGMETHVVETDETCWDLSGGTKTLLDVFLKANSMTIEDCPKMQVGTKVCAPTQKR
ncbi:hypothetical protein LINPERPRIM_LOCUS4261 [Linum perenne]